MKIHYLEENGVVLVNFPVEPSDEGLVYDMPMAEVARQVTEQIPEHLRSAVTIDFDKIPAWEMREKILERSNGGPLNEEHVIGSAEQQLLELIGVGE